MTLEEKLEALKKELGDSIDDEEWSRNFHKNEMEIYNKTGNIGQAVFFIVAAFFIAGYYFLDFKLSTTIFWIFISYVAFGSINDRLIIQEYVKMMSAGTKAEVYRKILNSLKNMD